MSRRKLTIIKSFVVGLIIIFLYFNAKAATIGQPANQDVSMVIKLQLNKGKLNYPLSVRKFYQINTYKMSWIAPDTVKMHALDALLLLDCVSQYGFDQTDFHPQQLVNKQLQLLTELDSKADVAEKVSFDILLTDAMLTLINNLHYGKVNPNFPASKIDRENSDELVASTWLIKAMADQDFMKTVLSVQPKSKMYKDLQDLMRLMTGQYIGDSYVVPVGRIKKVAINMERLRWLKPGLPGHITINVPSQSLWYSSAGKVNRFPIHIELPSQLVPMVEASLVAVWTGTLISTQQKQVSAAKRLLFLALKDDFHTYLPFGDHSHVYIEQGERLAEWLLTNDGSANKISGLLKAMEAGSQQQFILKRTVAIKIIYITCELKDGIFVQYPDSYELDKDLENALYKQTKI